MPADMMTNPAAVDQLALVTAFESQVNPVMARLTGAGFYVTQINTSGGLLYEARISLLMRCMYSKWPGLSSLAVTMGYSSTVSTGVETSTRKP